MQTEETNIQWSLTAKILFRFFAVYLFLVIFPFPLDLFLGSGFSLYTLPVGWFGSTFFHTANNLAPANNGSGDGLFSWVEQGLFVSMAAIACIVWSVVDRKKKNYLLGFIYLTTYIRYYLAFYLVTYGLAKVFTGQFDQPGLYRLNQAYGESSPMGLAWTFFGYSTAYRVFTGVFETLAGIFMLFRRTTILGALLSLVVMTNIVMINFCFDVPVKIFSSQLLLCTCLLLVPYARRLVAFFVLGKDVQAYYFPKLEFPGRLARVRKIGKSVIFAVFILLLSMEAYSTIAESDDVHPPLYGSYTARRFTINRAAASLTDDSLVWTRLVVSHAGSAMVNCGDKKINCETRIDTGKKKLTVLMGKHRYEFSYIVRDTTLLLSGNCDNCFVSALFSRKTENDYLLMSRGFHWVNEVPFNR